MFRRIAFLFVIGVFIVAPFSASAATVNFFGPIVDERCRCEAETTNFTVDFYGEGNPVGIDSAPDWACVIATIQNAIAVGITFIIVIITLSIAYAGIMIMVQPTNAGHREEGRAMVTNAVLGLVVVLTAWLIVDFVMKAFYDQAKGEQILGSSVPLPWNSIIADDATPDQLCFKPRGNIGLQGEPTPEDVVVPGGETPATDTTPAEPGGAPPEPDNGDAVVRPPTPTGFWAQVSGTTVNLAWNVVPSSVDRLSIDKAVEGDTTYSLASPSYISTDKTSYAFTGAQPGKKYTFRLFAWNEQGYSVPNWINVNIPSASTGGGGTACTNAQVAVDSGVVVSQKAQDTLKSLLNSACITVTARITSGYRAPDHQARVMYENILATSVSAQKALYGASGDAVIDVYTQQKNAGKNETEIKAAMTAKIIEIGPGKVSAHSDQAHNTFDVAPSSITSSNYAKFETALKNAKASGLIYDYITPPKDPAYHIEVTIPI